MKRIYRMLYLVLVYRHGRENVNRKALIDGKRKASYNNFKYLDKQLIPRSFGKRDVKRNSRYVGGFLSPVRGFVFLSLDEKIAKCRFERKGGNDGKKNVF
ncbi:MAG: hypothetical protein AB9917_21105 [Negativicutes bacterium]